MSSLLSLAMLKLILKLIIPGLCKGEPGLYFAISPSTEMTPALRGPAADDQMLRSQTMCHVAAVFCKNCPSATLGYQFDPSIRWNIVVSRFHLIDEF